ncbi:Rho termination factor N-terminal domain-containing protein [Synechococcus sp. PCC 7502]|uniref:Rho termination factor N-terminal domain-containing protein n=1 Tax=Synechococcus sp. PCC 7502 TaxID=1173263 RepID=UPI001181B5EE|nr:Rho termination factor N-terminal domain-containing protein [Synechococcus sp. PCC 7502]
MGLYFRGFICSSYLKFGITALLAIALATIILIDGLQLIANLFQSLTEERKVILKDQLLLNPVIPIKFPNYKPKWMIDLLPRKYLTIKYLKAWAKQLKIKNYSKLRKSNLVLAISPAG